MVSNGASALAPQFSADGRRVFYYAEPNSLMSVAIDPPRGLSASTPVKRLRPEGAVHVDDSEWALMPDGRLLAIQKGAGEDDITQFNVITNWNSQCPIVRENALKISAATAGMACAICVRSRIDRGRRRWATHTPTSRASRLSRF